ncbi:MAG: hypothetical protein LBR21_09710 [Propionibacteriaceae bacterium]|nr:hypothetical protein [Propionibacteriaceae bacterium]
MLQKKMAGATIGLVTFGLSFAGLTAPAQAAVVYPSWSGDASITTGDLYAPQCGVANDFGAASVTNNIYVDGALQTITVTEDQDAKNAQGEQLYDKDGNKVVIKVKKQVPAQSYTPGINDFGKTLTTRCEYTYNIGVDEKGNPQKLTQTSDLGTGTLVQYWDKAKDVKLVVTGTPKVGETLGVAFVRDNKGTEPILPDGYTYTVAWNRLPQGLSHHTEAGVVVGDETSYSVAKADLDRTLCADATIRVRGLNVLATKANQAAVVEGQMTIIYDGVEKAKTAAPKAATAKITVKKAASIKKNKTTTYKITVKASSKAAAGYVSLVKSSNSKILSIAKLKNGKATIKVKHANKGTQHVKVKFVSTSTAVKNATKSIKITVK